MTFAAREESRYSGAPVNLYLFQSAPQSATEYNMGFEPGEIGPFAFTNGETEVVRSGITYTPWPVSHSEISSDGTLDKTNLTVTLARGTELDALFNAYAPNQVVNLVIFAGHMGDEPSPENYPVEWTGIIRGANYDGENQLIFSAEPNSTSMRRPGLWRNYQLTCPHALYGEECQASLLSATITRTVTNVSGTELMVSEASVISPDKYIGGIITWTKQSGQREIRTIVNYSNNLVRVRGPLVGLTVGSQVKLTLGCNRTMSDCSTLHGNILNFGGQPFIPLENPISSSSNFY